MYSMIKRIETQYKDALCLPPIDPSHIEMKQHPFVNVWIEKEEPIRYSRREVISMMINTSAKVSLSEAAENFSRVAQMVDEQGSVVILKNNTPRYLLIEYSQAEDLQTASDEEVLSVSSRLIEKNHAAYEVLAK